MLMLIAPFTEVISVLVFCFVRIVLPVKLLPNAEAGLALRSLNTIV